MQGEIAQLISLVSFGNEFLKTGMQPVDFFPGNTTFQYCNLVEFRDVCQYQYDEVVYANDPLVWFENLLEGGCTKLRLFYMPVNGKNNRREYETVGFVGGGGHWAIESIFDGYSCFWQKKWAITREKATDRKIWSVFYSRVMERNYIANQQQEIEKKAGTLDGILNRLIVFCKSKQLPYWQGWFEKALATLESREPGKEFYHYDILATENYSLPARQLLFAIGHSWVFGGMGSWNDVGWFKDKSTQEIYHELSRDLYETLVQGIIAAVNSF